MRVILEIVQEMVMVLLIAEVLAAILAVPMWAVITKFLYPSISFLDAWAVSSVLVVSVVVVAWVADIAKGVNL